MVSSTRYEQLRRSKHVLTYVYPGAHGGFVGATPNEIHTLSTSSETQSFLVRSAFRSNDTSDLEQSATGTVDIEKNSFLVDELHVILKSLPTDVDYDGKFSIEWGSDDLTWKNQRREGMKKAASEENTKFKRATDIIEDLVRKAE